MIELAVIVTFERRMTSRTLRDGAKRRSLALIHENFGP
ncbi:hypothetical protein Z946_2797 [Sulfitobacter noctilucicola]|nr:hypothetical protein Z946_2797 [Sulfitobacter noctilucicola]